MRPETFGSRLRKRRKDLGLGLRETARPIGKSATILSRVETGREEPLLKEETIRILADVLLDDFDELMLLAGKLPSDVLDGLRRYPWMLDALRRKLASLDRKEPSRE